jgi:putative ATP-dependent endonuclease of OLD family
LGVEAEGLPDAAQGDREGAEIKGGIEEAVQAGIQEFQVFQEGVLAGGFLLALLKVKVAGEMLGVAAEGRGAEAELPAQGAVGHPLDEAAVDLPEGGVRTDRTAWHHKYTPRQKFPRNAGWFQVIKAGEGRPARTGRMAGKTSRIKETIFTFYFSPPGMVYVHKTRLNSSGGAAMVLRWLHIKNFRSCKDVRIQCGPMHALVGANNAGKSSILRALDFLFNPAAAKITEEAFWNKDTSLVIWIEALFDGLTPEETDTLKGYLRPEGAFHMARSAKIDVQTEEAGEPASTDQGKVGISQHFCRPMPKVEWLCQSKISLKTIDEWWKEKDKLLANKESFAAFVGFSKPNVTTWKEKAEEFASKYLTNDDFEDYWADNPKGYAGVLKGTLPHFFLIPAVRDVTDEAKVTKTNPLGRLLFAVLDGVTQQQRGTIDQALQEMSKMLNKAGGAERLPGIVNTENRLNTILKEYMECDLEIEFQPPTLEIILTTPKLFADDGFRNIIENKGHGLQRAIIFSIIRCYSELVTGRGEHKKRTMIFAVEEPELYMHPQAQRTLRRVFKNITLNGDQVIFSTHSALLLDVSDFDEIIRVEAIQTAAGGTKTVYTRIWQLPMGAMIRDIQSRHPGVKATPESLRELYSNAYHPMRAEGFFAKKIILVEGATEQYALPIYAEAAGHPLDNLNISVVDCGGKGPIDRLYRIFNELGIPCYMLFDYDKNNPDNEILAKSRELLQMVNQPPDPPNEIFIKDNIACFPNKWESDLAAEIPDLPTLTAEARKKLGLKGDSGKALVARYVAKALTARTPAEIPTSLKTIIEKAINLTWTKSCLADSEPTVRLMVPID